MRVVNEAHETITDYDLSKGCLVPALIIREHASPVDGVEKVAWNDDDYENVQMYVSYESLGPLIGNCAPAKADEPVEQTI